MVGERDRGAFAETEDERPAKSRSRAGSMTRPGTHGTVRVRGSEPAPPPKVGWAVAQFIAGSLAAIAVVLVGGFFGFRSVALDEAKRGTIDEVQDAGRLMQATALTDGVLDRDPKALARLDDRVLAQVVGDPIVRVKVWSTDGTVLYSDVPELVGRRFRLGDEERRLFRVGGAEAEVSDLSKPENRYERQEGKLLEAYTPIRTPNGTPVLFEIYERFDSVSADAERLLRSFATPILGALAVLLLCQAPLAWTMARRLQQGHVERETLLGGTIEALEQERRRIASNLHDGAVQYVAGVAFGLAPIAARADARGDASEAAQLRDSAAMLQRGVRAMRTLLIELYPPGLETAGLPVALSDLLSPLQASGIRTELEVDDRANAGTNGDALVYRVASEAVRNAKAHAEARSVRVALTRPTPRTVRLVVRDDGKGFSAADRDRRSAEGHVGLTLLDSLVRRSGGTLAVRSAPGQGTTVELEIPVP